MDETQGRLEVGLCHGEVAEERIAGSDEPVSAQQRGMVAASLRMRKCLGRALQRVSYLRAVGMPAPQSILHGESIRLLRRIGFDKLVRALESPCGANGSETMCAAVRVP